MKFKENILLNIINSVFLLKNFIFLRTINFINWLKKIYELKKKLELKKIFKKTKKNLNDKNKEKWIK